MPKPSTASPTNAKAKHNMPNNCQSQTPVATKADSTADARGDCGGLDSMVDARNDYGDLYGDGVLLELCFVCSCGVCN